MILQTLTPDDQQFIEELKDYIKIFTNPEPVKKLQSLNSLPEKLSPYNFI